MWSQKSKRTGMPPPLHTSRKDTRDQRRTSCCGCRQRKAKCSRTWPCVSCTMRKEECIWDGGIPIPDSSTVLSDAQAEIARLRALVASLMEREHGRDGAPDSPPEEELAHRDPPKLSTRSLYGTQFGFPPDCTCQNPSATHKSSATQSHYQAPPPPPNILSSEPTSNSPCCPFPAYPGAYYIPQVTAYPHYTSPTQQPHAPPALDVSNLSSSQAAYPYPYGLPSPSASMSYTGGPPGSPTTSGSASTRGSWGSWDGRSEYSEIWRGEYGEPHFPLCEIGENGRSWREGEEGG